MRSPFRLGFPLLLLTALTFLPLTPIGAQSAASKKNVPISFLPPPLENASYSLGIYEAKSGKLVRRLHEAATENAFTAGLNGLITKWDGKDDEGKPVPPGRYAARGYGVGPLKVEGVEFIGNDWTDEDESLRFKYVNAIALVPADDGLAVAATLVNGDNLLLRLSGGDGSVLWKRPLPPPTGGAAAKNSLSIALFASDGGIVVVQPRETPAGFRLSDGAKQELAEDEARRLRELKPDALDFSRNLRSEGKEETHWLIETGGGGALYQLPKGSDPEELLAAPDRIPALALRGLMRKENEPRFRAISASSSHDKLYLLEDMPGWQRVRGLSWVNTKDEEGKKVSDWETFFERNIRQADPALGLSDPAVTKLPPAPPVKLDLVENPLSPGKSPSVELVAGFDENGSYLVTADGLRLRKISKQADLRAVKLVKGDSAASLTLFQNDGAAWEEFSIKGANEMMSFDAGEFEMTANGEKPVETKTAEPPDL